MSSKSDSAALRLQRSVKSEFIIRLISPVIFHLCCRLFESQPSNTIEQVLVDCCLTGFFFLMTDDFTGYGFITKQLKS